ncbi:hypothetical protein [Flaviflagellibacter deserti]|uniref:Uncharacterized protein n=1 Tax=Flaviflagellibacter deserti TaxID=2267266 RepID=A0ABV9Z4J7_9HYPH
MDASEASRLKAHLDEAIKQLSAAIAVASEVGSAAEVLSIKRSLGDLIARVDALLVGKIYSEHPDLDDLRGK